MLPAEERLFVEAVALFDDRRLLQAYDEMLWEAVYGIPRKSLPHMCSVLRILRSTLDQRGITWEHMETVLDGV